MTRKALLPMLLLVSLALSACGGGGGGGDGGSVGTLPIEAPPPADNSGQTISSTLQGKQNGFTYVIQTYLPASYASGSTSLPVIYVTEGDAPYGVGGRSRFDVFRQAMQGRGTQAILVGISGTARRNVDFLLPGARQYVDFIAKDLAPAIERQYRADPRRRALSGLSHGGYLVVAALVLEGSAGPLSFSHYLSTESSVGGHGNLDAYLAFERQLDTSGNATPATLFLAGARNGNGAVIVNPLFAQMSGHVHPGLTLTKAEYDTTHVGADLPAFEEALARFFP